MKRFGMVILGLLVGLTLGCVAAFAQLPPDNVAGNWTITSADIDNGGMQSKFVQIVQNGTELSGYFQGPNQSGAITGHVDIHHIEFSTVTRNVLTFRGVINGNAISGLYGLHGRHAEWSAVRQGVPESVTVYTAPAPAPPDQLESLVAPIALYPDALVAQVLAAATFPEQLAVADTWMTQNGNLTGTPLMQAVDQQSWDASVKGLTQFPAVLHELASNLAWTSNLGQAFQNQQAEVMAAVQTMRAKAQNAGSLQTNSQVTVAQSTPGTIVIAPANPQVVYVPQYNPTVIYGAPIAVPLYTPPVGVSAGVTFGAGVAVGAFLGGGVGFGGVIGGGGGGFGWGWAAWHCNWGGGGGGGTVIYNNNTYIHNNTWHNNTWNNNNNWHGYHPWGPGQHGDGPYGPHPYTPNGGHNGDHGLIGGNGGVEHGPNGGRNGDGGLIGGQGGVDHGPNGGRNGNGGLVGGNASTQRPATDGGDHATDGNRTGTQARPANSDANRDRDAQQRGSRMSGDGRANRTESNRGQRSMSRPRPQRASHPQHVSHPHPASHGGGGHRR